ncbi:hypothetical protein D9758_003525 [Tetrapyrgos nigripes]|uniref:Aldehyde dehydrogenase domain-containing protein n=1 Tax=Tetrapyrgos nigripes TaxID=182062 RepID=A0A8H5GV62_9AGAR|nr:hypothetical protein D9758_003525 [Tetrapyrgos nigripes]
MSNVFTLSLNTPAYKGTVSCKTDLYINGQWVKPAEGGAIDVVNPATGKLITSVSAGTSKDVDIAVEAAQKAYQTSWGLKVPGTVRAELLFKLIALFDDNAEEFAALEALNCGKPYGSAKQFDIALCRSTLKYYAGWADKTHGETVETEENKLVYTRREPYGVVGAITPWNAPLVLDISSSRRWSMYLTLRLQGLFLLKIIPALATGNTIVIKPSEITPLTALRFADLIAQAGFPPGVVNIVNGYGNTVGEAIAHHPEIRKLSFTGSALTGRKIQEASAKTNLKAVNLELGGKSPSIIFDDANLEQTVKWASAGIFANMGQICTAGSRIFVQEGIYDAFLKGFIAESQVFEAQTGDPFSGNTLHGPQISQTQFDRVMSYIDSGKSDGATVQIGGERHGTEGYFIKPTIFTDCKPEMKMVQEEIFGPVAAVIKFKTEEEAIRMANNTTYGLACGVFTENGSRALRVAHALEAGTAWVNCYNSFDIKVPFGGYKMSGFGREYGKASLELYTQVKAVHINIGMKL